MNSLDTNILVYAADSSEPAKQDVALKLVAKASREGWPICAQVYGEFFNAAIRRKHASRAEARSVIDAWKLLMPPIASSLAAHDSALELATTHQVQFWDALIIATCAEHGVKQLFSEDGPGIAKPLGVRCTNPF